MLRPAEPAPAAASPASSRPSDARYARALVALGLGGLAVITFVNPSASRLYTWPMAAIVLAFWLFPIGLLIGGLVGETRWRPPPRLILLGLFLLAAGAIASAALSPFAAASLPRIWPTVGGAALYLVLHHAWAGAPRSGSTDPSAVGRVLGYIGVAFAFVSLAEWFGSARFSFWGTRNAAPFGHSIYTAGAVVLVLPWVVAQLWTARGASRWLWILGAMAAIVVLVSTSSRGGVLAVAIVGAVAVMILLARSRWSIGHKLLLVGGLVMAGAVVVFTNQRLRDLVVHRQWTESARESNAQRRAMIDAGIKLGLERPALGWGPGTVPLAYPHVRAALDGGTENILQLHNTPAQLFATTGALGLLGGLLLVLGALGAALRAPLTPLTAAASASLGGYALFALTDHQLDVPLFSFLAAVGLAVLTAAAYPDNRSLAPSRPLRVSLAFLFALIGGTAAWLSFPDLRARQRYDRGLTALSENRSDDYLRALDAATSATPHDPFFDHQAAAWRLEQRHLTPDPAKQTALTQDAIQHLERSLATGAHQEYPHFTLGWLLLDTRPAEAARHFIAAARCAPDKGGVYFGLGLAFHASGNATAAQRCFALEIINDPRQLTAPAWELPALAALRPGVQQEVIRLYEQLRGNVTGAATIAAWTRWWWGEPVSVAELQPGFNAESARMIGVLPAIMKREALTLTGDAWAPLYAAWRTTSGRPTAGPAAFAAITGNDRDYATALARRAQRAEDFRSFLAGPVGNEAALLRTLHRQRIGYGLLALHPEGPPISDVFVVQENRVVADFASGLFPPKGWIPGRFLLALLPPPP